MIRETVIFFLPLLIWYIHGKYGIDGSFPVAIIFSFLFTFLSLISRCQDKTKTPNYFNAIKLSIPMVVTFSLLILVFIIGDRISNITTKQVLLSPATPVIAGFIASFLIYSPISDSSVCKG